MSAGKLDRRIIIQRKTVTYSPSGEPIEAWTPFATVWGAAIPLRGEERFSNPQLAARGFVTFRVRWSSAMASVGPLDRIAYDGKVYDILAARDIGRWREREFDAVVREA